VGLGHVADGTSSDIFAGLANRIAAMPLVAHLRQHLLVSRCLGQGVTLVNIVGQWLLRRIWLRSFLVRSNELDVVV
jgi:hypothetical protein